MGAKSKTFQRVHTVNPTARLRRKISANLGADKPGRAGDKKCLHISNPKPERQKKPLPLISSSQAAAFGLPADFRGKPSAESGWFSAEAKRVLLGEDF
jgi:hypothetical protein